MRVRTGGGRLDEAPHPGTVTSDEYGLRFGVAIPAARGALRDVFPSVGLDGTHGRDHLYGFVRSGCATIASFPQCDYAGNTCAAPGDPNVGR